MNATDRFANNDGESSITRSEYDRTLAVCEGFAHTAPSTVRNVSFIGTSQTFIVTSYRMPERGDTVFLEMISGEGSLRLVIPPKVVDVIVRQREALTTQVRRKIGKASAEARKARGEKPGFMKMSRPPADMKNPPKNGGRQ